MNPRLKSEEQSASPRQLVSAIYSLPPHTLRYSLAINEARGSISFWNTTFLFQIGIEIASLPERL